MKSRRLSTRRYSNEYQGKFKPGYIFPSQFEEKKVLSYCINLIQSRISSSRATELFEMCSEILGQSWLAPFVIDQVLNEGGEIDEKIDDDFEALQRKLSLKDIKALLQNEILREAKSRLKRRRGEEFKGLEDRLSEIENVFILSKEEIELLTLFYLLEANGVLEDYLTNKHSVMDINNGPLVRTHGKYIIGLSSNKIRNAVSSKILFNADLLESSSAYYIKVSDWCCNYLSGIGNKSLTSEFFSNPKQSNLNISDFPCTKTDMEIIDALIRKQGATNILFYGAPGTGKTSFSSCLSKRYRKKPYQVKIPEEGEHKDWLRALHATVALAAKDNSIVIIDEADELLNSYGSFFFQEKSGKGWVNSFMDKHDQKIIWITNQTRNIDPSTMRRFSYSIEFKDFDANARQKILKSELARMNLKDYFTTNELQDLCQSYPVNADGIVSALKQLMITSEMPKETALKRVKAIMHSNAKATGRLGTHEPKMVADNYCLDGINPDRDIIELTRAFHNFNKRDFQSSQSRGGAMSALFYGQPGTGKTEYVYYLGKIMKTEVLLKRCSDIESMWVGETEKNIALAFIEAREKNCILFFDEADSFLNSRENAIHSWERQSTNEMLTQMEAFTGIVLFATNDIQGLDHASLRRFKFKVEFQPLSPEGNILFFKTLLKDISISSRRLTKDISSELKSLSGLTPGDFRTVKDQIVFCESRDIEHIDIINLLRAELKMKAGISKPIGFTAYS